MNNITELVQIAEALDFEINTAINHVDEVRIQSLLGNLKDLSDDLNDFIKNIES